MDSNRSAARDDSSVVVVVRNVEHLGNALMRFRKLQALSQQVLGERAGIKQIGVSSVESGAAGTRLGTLFKLLAALDLELIIRRRRKD